MGFNIAYSIFCNFTFNDKIMEQFAIGFKTFFVEQATQGIVRCREF